MGAKPMGRQVTYALVNHHFKKGEIVESVESRSPNIETLYKVIEKMAGTNLVKDLSIATLNTFQPGCVIFHLDHHFPLPQWSVYVVKMGACSMYVTETPVCMWKVVDVDKTIKSIKTVKCDASFTLSTSEDSRMTQIESVLDSIAIASAQCMSLDKSKCLYSKAIDNGLNFLGGSDKLKGEMIDRMLTQVNALQLALLAKRGEGFPLP